MRMSAFIFTTEIKRKNIMFSALTSLLYNWTNGVIMIAVFGLVVFILIGILVNFMTSNKDGSASNSEDQ